MIAQQGNGFRFDLRELNGALGDLGTLLPLMLGTIAVAGLAPVPVVLGFASAYIATGLVYRLPVPVQPMKAVAAVLLTTQMTPYAVAASGVIMGTALLVLAATGWIDRLARLLPQSVLAGLQLGLGAALALVSLDLMASAPLLAGVVLLPLVAGVFLPRAPAALIAVVVAILAAPVFGTDALPVPATTWAAPAFVGLPSWAEVERGAALLALPQLALTFTNAIVLTALVAGDYFGDRARHVTPRRLAATSGLGNLLLAPFGALPMCHGAGGLAAHHRFGARSGGAPLMLGLALLALALLPGGAGLAVLAAIPAAGLGALLLVASIELASSRRLWDCRPSCYPVIATTAAVTASADPFWGLAAGTAAEALRMALLRAVIGGTRS
jgi:MFS superfamily sulfate permease-like transporter